MNNFFALAMRTLNMEDAESIGNTEIHALMDHFGEEKVLLIIHIFQIFFFTILI